MTEDKVIKKMQNIQRYFCDNVVDGKCLIAVAKILHDCGKHVEYIATMQITDTDYNYSYQGKSELDALDAMEKDVKNIIEN